MEEQDEKDLQLQLLEWQQRAKKKQWADNLQRAKPKLAMFKWGKPLKGWYRIDTDGSIKISLRKDGSVRKWVKGGYRAIVRDHNGTLIRAVAGVSDKPVSILYHQYQGFKKGLELALSHAQGPVEVFTTSLFVYHLFRLELGWYDDEEDCEAVNSILGEIKKLISDNDHLWVQYTRKSSNRAADYLANRFKEIDIGVDNECG